MRRFALPRCVRRGLSTTRTSVANQRIPGKSPKIIVWSQASPTLLRDTRFIEYVFHPSSSRLERNGVSRPSRTKSLKERLEASAEWLLPRDYYHNSVKSGYFGYAINASASAVLGTAASVISMQLMLSALGLASGVASPSTSESSRYLLPVSATLSWVLKDGLGQFGGMLVAKTVNTKFDADPKRWRLVADGLLVSCVTLEALTLFTPSWSFLALASLANVGKNVAWLSTSATRASIHQSFTNRGNLGDVTAKAGAQTIAASVVGTLLGIGITAISSSDSRIMFGFVIGLGTAQIGFSYLALSRVAVETLNSQRAWLVLEEVFSQHKKDGRIDWSGLLTPSLVAKKEDFVRGNKNFFLPSSRVTLPLRLHRLYVGESLDKVYKASKSSSTLMSVSQEIKEDFRDEHLVCVDDSGKRVFLLYFNLIDDDRKRFALANGFLHAALVLNRLASSSPSPYNNMISSTEEEVEKAMRETREWMRMNHATEGFLAGLKVKGWNVDSMEFIEERAARIVGVEEEGRFS